MDWERRNERVAVLVAFIFALVIRIMGRWSALSGGDILFDGFDEFYHMRRIIYGVAHFPQTLWFDSYLYYPKGAEITWPPLFDQLVSATALLLGQRSEGGIEMVGALIPPILGSLTILAVYLLIREAFDRKTAVIAAFLTAIAPYSFQKSMLASTDHHSLETLLLILAILFLSLALSQRHRVLFAILAGLSMAGIAYTWMGAGAYFAIILVYAVTQMTLDLRQGKTSKDLVTVLVIAFAADLLLLAPNWNRIWLYPSFAATAAILLAIVLLYALSIPMREYKIPWPALPAAVFLGAYVFIILAHLLSGYSDIFAGVDRLASYGMDYLFGEGLTGKVAEAEPLWVNVNFFSYFGLQLLFSLVGLAALIAAVLRSGIKGPQLLFLVWTVSVLLLTLGQKRFLYLYSINMAILTGILFLLAAEWLEKKPIFKSEGAYKAALVLLLVCLVFPSAGEVLSISQDRPFIAGDWYDSLTWLEKNTPPTSYFDDPSQTPEYSVFSWWDFGNWIIYQAKRPVVANNFQLGVYEAASFFLSESEVAAAAILDSHKSKYVITDFDMLYGKLPAMAIWLNENPDTYRQIEDLGGFVNVRPTERLMATMMARLHFFDGSTMGHFRLIYESRTMLGANPPSSRVKIFEYVPGATIRVRTSPDNKVGALLNLTSNQGRGFQYVTEGVKKDDVFEIRVPYSTDRGHDTHAIDPYLVFAGNQSRVRTEKVEVKEDDVLKGRTIDVSL
jgi:dolichyl-diphosphooligosaccharide--protein glycosyltransferase